MSCPHGDIEEVCDHCIALNASYEAGFKAGRAAVAELIEVASLFDSCTAADMGDTSILDQEELRDRLGIALRRVKGEAE